MKKYEVDIKGSNVDIWDNEANEGIVISYVDKERRTRIYASHIKDFVKEMNNLIEENKELKNNSKMFNYLIKELDKYISQYEDYYTKYQQTEYLEVVSILSNIKNKMRGVD